MRLPGAEAHAAGGARGRAGGGEAVLEAPETVLVLDFGGQYTQLIARRIRELGVFSLIVPAETPAAELRALTPRGLVLSGGPASVYDEGAPRADRGLWSLGIPILGICYGLQLCCLDLGGEVARGSSGGEYGRAPVEVLGGDPLLRDVPHTLTVWMSHEDILRRLPDGFTRLATSRGAPIAAAADARRKIWGVQFHPEVTHTEHGMRILGNFLRGICGCEATWRMASYADLAVARVRETAGEDEILCALSGGVDSSVVAALLARAVGPRRVHAVFVDTGLLRKGEREHVEKAFRERFPIDLHVSDASARFFEALHGISDPERKRITIGHRFIDVFREQAAVLRPAREGARIRFLAQGTLYTDVIESRSPRGGPSATIKSHHNVGGLPEKLGFELVEPLRDLFKDEVRRLGAELGLDEETLWRHPFPGPGLAVRVLGEVTRERCETLREADGIVEEEIRRAGLYRELWQAFAVLLPVSTVGVMGDGRTYANACVVRAVRSEDGMTADWADLPREVLEAISSRIVNEVAGINRVAYDISSKPPATIEWE